MAPSTSLCTGVLECTPAVWQPGPDARNRLYVVVAEQRARRGADWAAGYGVWGVWAGGLVADRCSASCAGRCRCRWPRGGGADPRAGGVARGVPEWGERRVPSRECERPPSAGPGLSRSLLWCALPLAAACMCVCVRGQQLGAVGVRACEEARARGRAFAAAVQQAYGAGAHRFRAAWGAAGRAVAPSGAIKNARANPQGIGCRHAQGCAQLPSQRQPSPARP